MAKKADKKSKASAAASLPDAELMRLTIEFLKDRVAALEARLGVVEKEYLAWRAAPPMFTAVPEKPGKSYEFVHLADWPPISLPSNAASGCKS